MKLYVVMEGSPVDGFTAIGPFNQPHYASEWADTWVPDSDWWVLQLVSLEEYQHGRTAEKSDGGNDGFCPEI